MDNLKKWRDAINKTFNKGGYNFHISDSVGYIIYISDVKIINQKTGKEIVNFKAPAFETV